MMCLRRPTSLPVPSLIAGAKRLDQCRLPWLDWPADCSAHDPLPGPVEQYPAEQDGVKLAVRDFNIGNTIGDDLNVVVKIEKTFRHCAPSVEAPPYGYLNGHRCHISDTTGNRPNGIVVKIPTARFFAEPLLAGNASGRSDHKVPPISSMEPSATASARADVVDDSRIETHSRCAAKGASSSSNKAIATAPVEVRATRQCVQT